MSGHSKWHKIQHKKAQTDSKRSRLFSQLSRDISVAARTSRDPANNPALREAIERAKKANLPQANIDRLLSDDAQTQETVVYEGYAADGTALLIIATTDNTNRTVAEIRSLCKKHNATLASANSVRWKFSPTSSLTGTTTDVTDKDELELSLIDAGAIDIKKEGDDIQITTTPSAANELEQVLENQQVTNIERTDSYTVAPEQQKNLTADEKEIVTNIVKILSEHPDVVNVYTDAQG